MTRSTRFTRTALAVGGFATLLVAATLSTVTAETPKGAASQPSVKARASATATTTKAVKGTMPVKPATTPERIQVQHILIGFLKDAAPGQKERMSSVPGQPITRSMDEAKALAHKILDEARAGAPFDTLVKKYTEDSFPGIYGLSNFKVEANKANNEYPREGMVAAFGDVGFNLSVGNIDVAEYDQTKSPFGWHIIKRLK
ncbi:MAG: peptidylprolyl isomerase [Candidatus Eisenbacteria bacterium]|nr:peptidylprolyl isomerase [Candidatus Eisenbacteria bacterium]